MCCFEALRCATPGAGGLLAGATRKANITVSCPYCSAMAAPRSSTWAAQKQTCFTNEKSECCSADLLLLVPLLLHCCQAPLPLQF